MCVDGFDSTLKKEKENAYISLKRIFRENCQEAKQFLNLKNYHMPYSKCSKPSTHISPNPRGEIGGRGQKFGTTRHEPFQPIGSESLIANQTVKIYRYYTG